MKNLALTLIFATAIVACKPKHDDPIAPAPPSNEEELITTLELHFHSAGDTEHKHFTFRDLDGDGGNAPVIIVDTLSADTVYSVEIEVLDESTSPVADITEEIHDEGTVHQFFFQPNPASVTMVYTDADANGRPIGLNSTWTIGAISNGTVTVTLRHLLDKAASGVSDGDITNAGGETDIEVTFPLVIE